MRRSFEIGHAGSGALRMELEIDGDDSSTTTADGSELQLQNEGAAEIKFDNAIADGRSNRGRAKVQRSGRASPARKWPGGAACSCCAQPWDGWAAARHAGSLSGSQGRDGMRAQAVCGCSMHACTRFRLLFACRRDARARSDLHVLSCRRRVLLQVCLC